MRTLLLIIMSVCLIAMTSKPMPTFSIDTNKQYYPEFKTVPDLRKIVTAKKDWDVINKRIDAEIEIERQRISKIKN